MKPQVLRGDALEMGPLHKARTLEDCNCFVKRENKLPTGPGRQPGNLSQLVSAVTLPGKTCSFLFRKAWGLNQPMGWDTQITIKVNPRLFLCLGCPTEAAVRVQ